MTADPREQAAEEAGAPAASPAGGIVIGSMSGGAVAAGERAVAEDRSRRAERPVPPPSAAPDLPAPPPGGIGIGTLTGGAVASGPDARALDASTELIEAPPGLAPAVATLREQLRILRPSPETAEVDAELAAVQEEIAGTGRVRGSRLAWLRERLDLGATAAAGLASAAAVLQFCVQLLG
jgi:hypothetical protein